MKEEILTNKIDQFASMKQSLPRKMSNEIEEILKFRVTHQEDSFEVDSPARTSFWRNRDPNSQKPIDSDDAPSDGL